jgi:hypothetical protein
LGDGSVGRLTKALVRGSEIATAAGAWYESDRIDQTMFSLYAVPASGVSLADLEAAVNAEIARLLREAHGELDAEAFTAALFEHLSWHLDISPRYFDSPLSEDRTVIVVTERSDPVVIAADPDLLRWVHIAFMDSFLRCHQLFSPRPLPGGADAYIRLWSKSVIPLGLTEVPMSEAELLSALKDYRPELTVSDETREVIRWIKHPPLPKTSLPAYRFLFRAALASLPREYQDMIGLGNPSLRYIQPVTTNLLRLIRFAIGPESPVEEAAIARLHRAGQMKNGKVVRETSPNPALS